MFGRVEQISNFGPNSVKNSFGKPLHLGPKDPFGMSMRMHKYALLMGVQREFGNSIYDEDRFFSPLVL